MGVELGKVLAKNILSQLGKPSDVTGHDSSVSVMKNDDQMDAYSVHCRPPALFTITKNTGESERVQMRGCTTAWSLGVFSRVNNSHRLKKL